MNRTDYAVSVESGKLLGSVRIVGDLPDTMTHDEAEKLEEAIRMIRGLHRFGSTGSVILHLEGTKFGN
jgi:hypothetical protein